MARLDYYSIDKEGFDKILAVQAHIAKGIEPKLLHLLYLRVSQINGCSYCVDMHWKDAIKAGVEPRVINGVVSWRYMPFFTPREKAMFQWAESVTRLPNQDVAEGDYQELLQHFSAAEIVTLTFAVSQMNALNRIAIASAQHPKS